MGSLWLMASLEIAVDDVYQLIRGLALERPGMTGAVHEVRSDMVLDDLCEQPIDGAPATRDQVHNLRAARLPLERPLDCLDLSADAAHAMQQFLLVANGVAHAITT